MWLPAYVVFGNSHVGAVREPPSPSRCPRGCGDPSFPRLLHPNPHLRRGQPLWLPVYVVFGNSHVGAVREPPSPSRCPRGCGDPSFPRLLHPSPYFVGATLVVARLRRVRQLPRRGGSGTALPLPLSSRMRGPIFPTPPTPIPVFVGATLVVARLRRVRRLPRRDGSGNRPPPPVVPAEPASVKTGAGTHLSHASYTHPRLRRRATLVVAHLRRVRRLPRRGGSGNRPPPPVVLAGAGTHLSHALTPVPPL